MNETVIHGLVATFLKTYDAAKMEAIWQLGVYVFLRVTNDVASFPNGCLAFWYNPHWAFEEMLRMLMVL